MQIVFVDLMPVIENNRIARAQLYDLLAKLNTYDHIERIFVMNSPSDRPADVPSDELYHNSDKTKLQYYMFNQMVGTSDFFNKVLNIDQSYKLNQAKTSDIVYITSQDNRELANLRQIYEQILNPNVITIKLNTQSAKSVIGGIHEVVEFLTLSRKPLSVRITNGALPANIQGKVLTYVDKYRPQDPSRTVLVYSAADKYREHHMDRAIFNMYLTDADTDLDGRIGSVTNSATARFLAKLLTGKSEISMPSPVKRGLASKLRRFTRKVLGRVSSRRQQQKALNQEFPIHKSSRRQISRKSKKSAKSVARVTEDGEPITNKLKQAAKYLEEIERLDTLIAESGKSRQQKQKTSAQRTIIENINSQYLQHRKGFVRAIRALFNVGTGTAKSRLHTVYSSTANSKTKQLVSRLIRVLDDKASINIHSVNNNNKLAPSVNTIMKDYKDTLRQNIAANPGFFKKLTRKRILSRL
jgi:hypothetical protein